MEPTGHQRLVLASPPKAVKEMTDAEITAWAQRVFASITGQQAPLP
jgi:hypothetical protein